MALNYIMSHFIVPAGNVVKWPLIDSQYQADWQQINNITPMPQILSVLIYIEYLSLLHVNVHVCQWIFVIVVVFLPHN